MQKRLTLSLVALALCAHEAESSTPWRPFKALKLFVASDLDPGARIFSARGHFLVAPTGSGRIFVLAPKTYTVHSADRSTLTDEGPVIDLEGGTDLELVGVLKKDGATLTWESGDTHFMLSHKPPLLGAVSLAALREHTDKYEFDVDAYVPDSAAVEALASISEPTDLVVGFGVWCPICAEWLPRFIKTIESAANENVAMTFVSINENLDRPADLLEAYSIDGVPTFIVRRDERELGRVTPDWLEEEPGAVLEKRLVEILGGS